jgi:uncharacterized membrane protein
VAANNGRRLMAPVEFVAIAGVLALFAGLTVLMVTRDVVTAFIASGIAFVAVIMVIAMLLLAMTPNTTPEGEKDKPDSGND